MGTSNQNASFGNAIGGALASAQSNGFVYNFTALDHITTGLASVGVCFHAVTFHVIHSHHQFLYTQVVYVQSEIGNTIDIGVWKAAFGIFKSCH